MTGITAACTCSVDGWSAGADTRYKGYSFTGCGAHVDYTLDLTSGAGYEQTWCYVTSPPDCAGESPYIPEGFKTDNTLPEWEAEGAAWKECYDGYRCEAWWGSLEGSAEGEPVILDAPLDWPDCCALCSNSVGDNTTARASPCSAWSFDPSTGSCQLISAVESISHDDSWGVNSTVHGYPGYFEAPITDCWSRTEYDLCVNTNVSLIVPGVILACCGLLGVWRQAFQPPSPRNKFLRKLLTDPHPARLVKAACVNVTCKKETLRFSKGGSRSSYFYQGTFITCDGALFVFPPSTGRHMGCDSGPFGEQTMLSVLFSTGLNPRADACVTRRCQTPSGLRSEFSKMVRAVPRHPIRESTRTLSCPEQDVASRSLDCLLLIGGGTHARAEVRCLLVGILGEDRITCVDTDQWGKNASHSFCCLFAAAATLVTLCITLLTNEAAQNMAHWTFDGDHRAGAVVGLVLCVSIPLALLAWARFRIWRFARLIRDTSPAIVERDGNPHA
ncbi:unnamed protein product [Hapterophycus canaliculatus]